jgi:hypothetical protein
VQFLGSSQLTNWDLIPGREKNLLHSIQSGLEAHPASHPMGIGGSFNAVKVTGT